MGKLLKKILEKIKNEIITSLWFLILKVCINIIFTIEYTYLVWFTYTKVNVVAFVLLGILWGFITLYALVRLILDIVAIVKKAKR